MPFHIQLDATIGAAPARDGHEESFVPFVETVELPPLLHGPSDTHMRLGVLNALHAAIKGEPNAEQPFLVADLGRVYGQHLRWLRCLPGIEPFYAVKCNPDPYILRLLAALGTGFDCASSSEITNVLNLSSTTIDSSRIIFANPCKATSSICNAARVNVSLMTFDNIDELYKIARVHREAKLVLRILVENSKARILLGRKFGAPFTTVPALLAKAKELSLDIVGVSFHVGSVCSDPSAFTNAVHRARIVFDMGAKVGYAFNLLDVGGGFDDASFESMASVLMDALDKWFPNRVGAGVAKIDRGESVRVIAEPGRFYVSQAFKLAVNIIARRVQAPVEDIQKSKGNDDLEMTEITEGELVAEDNEDNGPRTMYYINDGIYGALVCARLEPGTTQPYVLSMGGSFDVPITAPLQTCCIWGPTCDSRDCVFPTALLPQALCVGDWLAFDNMGAYTLSLAGRFNGFEVSKIIYTLGDKYAAEVRAALTEFVASTTTTPISGGTGYRCDNI